MFKYRRLMEDPVEPGAITSSLLTPKLAASSRRSSFSQPREEFHTQFSEEEFQRELEEHGSSSAKSIQLLIQLLQATSDWTRRRFSPQIGRTGTTFGSGSGFGIDYVFYVEYCWQGMKFFFINSFMQ